MQTLVPFSPCAGDPQQGELSMRHPDGWAWGCAQMSGTLLPRADISNSLHADAPSLSDSLPWPLLSPSACSVLTEGHGHHICPRWCHLIKCVVTLGLQRGWQVGACCCSCRACRALQLGSGFCSHEPVLAIAFPVPASVLSLHVKPPTSSVTSLLRFCKSHACCLSMVFIF